MYNILRVYINQIVHNFLLGKLLKQSCYYVNTMKQLLMHSVEITEIYSHAFLAKIS